MKSLKITPVKIGKYVTIYNEKYYITAHNEAGYYCVTTGEYNKRYYRDYGIAYKVLHNLIVRNIKNEILYLL